MGFIQIFDLLNEPLSVKNSQNIDKILKLGLKNFKLMSFSDFCF
jgi:hypothetical protein